jgi:hypothetical protein
MPQSERHGLLHQSDYLNQILRTDNGTTVYRRSPTSPEVDFRFDQHTLSIKGESYPENAAAFYGPVIAACRPIWTAARSRDHRQRLAGLLQQLQHQDAVHLFDALNKAAMAGNQVRLNWYHDEDDDTILEFGQELQDDFGALDHDHAVSN